MVKEELIGFLRWSLTVTQIKWHTVMAKNIGTLAILSENATLLSENCSNCKCFGIHAYCFCLHCNNTINRRKVKLDKISHRTQKWTGQSWLNLCVVCHTEYGEKSCLWIWEKKIVEKHGQSQGYKSISRDLNVPVSTVRNIIKRFTAHGTVANLPGCGRKSKINEKLQRRIVRMVDKEPLLTSKQIQADLQTQGTVSAHTVRRHLNEKGHYGRRPRRTPLLTQRHKKRKTGVWQNLCDKTTILLGERTVDRWDKSRAFW